jgi:hypothetical protein
MKALTRPYERSIDAVVTSSKALVRRSRKALLTWLLAVGTGMVHAIYPFPPPYYPVVYPPYWPQVSLIAIVRLFTSISRSLYRRLRRGCSNIRKNIRAPSCVLLRRYYGAIRR